MVLSLCIGSYCVAHGQLLDDDGKIRIKGVVVDQETGQPLPFTNIGLIGTIAGVSSDRDGYFELAVPGKYGNHTVRFSAIGYAPYEAKMRELAEKGELRVTLLPVSYSIGDVTVIGERMVVKGLFDRVVSRIRDNYIPRAYNYEGHFEYAVQVNDEPERVKEAIVTIYDADGYNRTNVEEAFQAIGYRYDQVRRNHEVSGAADGMVYFDDILTADVVRHTRNVLNTENYRDFTFTEKGRFLYEGDTVQIIGYETKKPTLTNTGNAHASACSGEIYIQQKNAVVLRHVMRITAPDYTVMGRDLLPVDEPAKEGPVTITITTDYKKMTSYYFLSGVSMEYRYNRGGNRITGQMQYHTTRVNVTQPEVINGRIYFEKMDPDYRFWDRYVITFEEE